MIRFKGKKCRIHIVSLWGFFWIIFYSTIIFAGEQKKPMLINFFMHTEDPINEELSHPAIRRVVEMFAETVGKADIYFTPNTAYSIGESKYEPGLSMLLSEYFKSGWGLGILFNNPHPEIRNVFAPLNWEEGWKMIMKYKMQYQDKITGEFDASRDGGDETLKRVFGQSADIFLRLVPENAYFHRLRNGYLSLGWYPTDFVSETCTPPLAWFMGMMAIMLYPLKGSPTTVNSMAVTDWHGSKKEIESQIKNFINGIPRDRPQFVYIGGHNVNMYANNEKWDATGRGHPRHVEAWAYGETENPPSIEAARIPPEFLYSQEQQDVAWRVRKNTLETFAQIVEEDPTVHIVAARDLDKFIEVKEQIILNQSELSVISQFILEKSRRGLPEYLEVGNQELTLAEGFQGLVYALSRFYRSENIKGSITVWKNVLGPVVIPGEWGGPAHNENVDGKEVSLSDITKAAQDVVSAIILNDPVAIPVSVKVGNLMMNAASFCYAMAQTYTNIIHGNLKSNINLRDLTLCPDPCLTSRLEWKSDEELSKETTNWKLLYLQLWTVKPVTFKF